MRENKAYLLVSVYLFCQISRGSFVWLVGSDLMALWDLRKMISFWQLGATTFCKIPQTQSGVSKRPPNGVNMCTACRFDCNCIQEKKVCSGAFRARQMEADGRIGKVSGEQQRKEGVFSHRRWRAGAKAGRGRAVYPGTQFPCYLSHCFFPSLLAFQLGRSQHERDWHSVNPPHHKKKKKLASGQESATFSQTLTQHGLVSQKWARSCLGFVYSTVRSQIALRFEYRRHTHPIRSPQVASSQISSHYRRV